MPKKVRIAWIVPEALEGGGGHRTIFQNVNTLVEAGYQCDIYIKSYNQSVAEIRHNIKKFFGEVKGNIKKGWKVQQKYDIAVATIWESVPVVEKCQCRHRLYFIQDFEPYFYSMGDRFILARNTYTPKLKGTTIGRWLACTINKKFNMEVSPFNFCADLKYYHPLTDIPKELSICYIFQPDKPRRCGILAIKALQIVQQIRPDIKIYIYGSRNHSIKDLKVKYLDILSVPECNQLYNQCTVGLCMSSTNPSRIPFEMMAAGLPVVDLYLENNLYDLPEDGCLLAEPKPDAIANAILQIINKTTLRKNLSQGGVKFMQNYPLEKGYQQFLQCINKIAANQPLDSTQFNKIYTREAVTSSTLTRKNYDSLAELNVFNDSETTTRIQLEEAVQARDQIIKSRDHEIKRLKNAIHEIQSAKSYKLITKLAKIKKKL